jgi:hypothetical protein
MGSACAMNSISRVIEKHEDEIVAELKEKYPSALIKSFTLENRIYNIGVTAILTDDSSIDLEPIDIDDLAEDYPDCEVGY